MTLSTPSPVELPQVSTTPPENPARSVREWESFFARWGGATKAEQEPAAAVLTQEDF